MIIGSKLRRWMPRKGRAPRLVEIGRKRIDPHNLRGFLLDVGDEFCLIHRVNDSIHLDGYSIIRTRDIASVVSPLHPAFIMRALALRREKPKLPRGIGLSGIAETLLSIERHSPLVTLHREARFRGECGIGSVCEVDGKSVRFLWLDTDAKWDGYETWLLRDITLLEFGGDYEEALALVAGIGK